MGTFYFIVAFVVILIFYGFSNHKLRKDYVIAGDSLASENLTPDEVREMSYYKKHRIIKDTKGNIINPQSIIRVAVSGNSMSPIGLKSGDEIIVMKINKRNSLSDQIKRDDILLIYLDNIGIYKIRAFDGFEGNNLRTYYFDSYGNKKMSSKPHAPESILGIVKYKTYINSQRGMNTSCKIENNGQNATHDYCRQGFQEVY